MNPLVSITIDFLCSHTYSTVHSCSQQIMILNKSNEHQMGFLKAGVNIYNIGT